MPRLHNSKEEALYCNKLKILCSYGEFEEYQAEVTFDLRDRDGKRVGGYKVDFLLTNMKDGRKQVVREYKGLRMMDWILRAALFTWNYPDIDYEVVDRRDLA